MDQIKPDFCTLAECPDAGRCDKDINTCRFDKAFALQGMYGERLPTVRVAYKGTFPVFCTLASFQSVYPKAVGEDAEALSPGESLDKGTMTVTRLW